MDSDRDDRRVSRDELSDRVEAILEETECLAEAEQKYPVRGEELATDYADRIMDLPNETESLGSVFDRLVDRRYDTPAEAREAVLNELTGEEDGLAEFNDQRALELLAADTRSVESIDEQHQER